MGAPQFNSGKEAACKGSVTLSPRTALVVDDSLAIRMIHSLHLRALGFQTRAVESGQEAVRLLESGRRFDVILMDYYMPEMNGAETTRMIRDMGIQCVILGVSTIDDHEVDIRANFIQSGLTEYFSMPLTRDMLIPYSAMA